MAAAVVCLLCFCPLYYMCAAVLVYLLSWSHNYVANVCVDLAVALWGRGRFRM